MKNPFKRYGSYNPSQYPGSSNKLIIIAGIVTFIIIIVVMFESVVVVQAGHRGVVLYVGVVENRALGEGIHFIIPFAEQIVPICIVCSKLLINAVCLARSNMIVQCDCTLTLISIASIFSDNSNPFICGMLMLKEDHRNVV